ncbi:MAG: ankyrin repeat domain-containing protein [Proteobacteria bacterium]|nr:ankyrin repeat domain-containing protein [Pseudomonadota bacterium]
MVDGGADLNAADYDGRTALHLAAAEGRLDVVAYLLNRGARVNVIDRWGGTPLQDAIRHTHDAIAQLLTEHGAVLRSEDAVSTMCRMAGEGNLAALRRLVDNGADPSLGDYDGRTPLHLAASEGHRDVVAYLIECGAPINVTDRWGGSPLDDAERHGHAEIADLLRSVPQANRQ